MELRSRYDLQVTEEDLARAKLKDSQKCMASQCIARTIPDAFGIKVDTQSVVFSVPDPNEEGKAVRLTFMTPPVLQAYVIAFDAGDELWPFKFRLQNPMVTSRTVNSPARLKAIRVSGAKTRKMVKEGATPEEVKAEWTATYKEVTDEAFQKAHEVHEALVEQGVENPVEKAAEAAGLLPTPPPVNLQRPNASMFTTVIERPAEGERGPTPRVFKSRRRSYGQRALRINWPIDPETGDRIKPEVTRLV